MPEENDIVIDICKRCVIGGISEFERDEMGAQVMRERNGRGCDRPRPFSVIAIWAGIVLAKCRESTVASAKSAVALVLCISAGGSEQLAHDGWGGGLLSCLERHSLRSENGAELPRQFQSRHNLVSDQRLSTAEPGSQGPVFVGIGGTHQSGLGTEGVRLLWSRHHHCCHQSWIAGKLTKLALNPEEPVPGAACPWGGRARGGQSTRMSVPRIPVSPHL